ncbi:heme-degrading domain-containing protein [Arthrobacter sp. Z4-13]
MTDNAFLQEIEADEQELQFTVFDRQEAWRLGCALRAAALERGLPLVIGITIGGQRVFHTALPGATPDNDLWLERKAAVVTHFERSSMGVGEHFRSLGRVFEEDSRLPMRRYAANGGVFPVRLRDSGLVVGTVGVSGLPQKDDHAFLVQQLRAFLHPGSAPTSAGYAHSGASAGPNTH